MIIKHKGHYDLISKTTRRHLGTFRTLTAAKKREKQVEFFKYAKKHHLKLRAFK